MLQRQTVDARPEPRELTRGPRLPSFDPGHRNAPVVKRATLEETLEALGLKKSDLKGKTKAAIEALVAEMNDLRDQLDSTELALGQAQSLADHDPLIPIYNRRAFLRELSRALSFCARYATSACLIYLDLDHFKSLNDRHGHAAGDEALQQVGTLLISLTRESDLIGRLGGDEFAALLINADEAAGRAKADEFRREIERISVGPARDSADLGASCGVVLWKRDETPEQFLARADEAMYAEKVTKSSRQTMDGPG